MASLEEKDRSRRKQSGALERIMNAALEEFQRSGPNGVKIEIVARKANVSKQLIYYYYGSRDVLYEAVLEEYSYIKIQQLLNIDFFKMTPSRAIEELVLEIMDHFEGIPLGILTMEPKPGDAMYARRSSRRRKVRDIFDVIVDRGIINGDFSEDVDKKACFEFVGMMISGFFVHRAMWCHSQANEVIDPTVWRDRIVDVMLSVLKRGVITSAHDTNSNGCNLPH
jgi:AcrR family transcriptional regulator